jgi:hypothetical protein
MRSILRPATATRLLANMLVTGGLLTGGLALSGGASLAQTATQAAKTAAPTAQPVAARPTPNMQAMVEQRIKDLHTRLHITAAEQSQWDQFAQSMRDNAKATDALYNARAEKMDTMTAVENMQSYAAIAQQHAEDMQKLLPAFQKLYDSFSDAQKKQADQVFRTYAQQAQQSHAAKK